jgi:hypothetical protein
MEQIAVKIPKNIDLNEKHILESVKMIVLTGMREGEILMKLWRINRGLYTPSYYGKSTSCNLKFHHRSPSGYYPDANPDTYPDSLNSNVIHFCM